MVIGIGELVGKAWLSAIATLLLPAMLGIMYVTGGDWILLAYTVAIAPHAFIAIGLVFIHFKYSMDLRLLIAGWVNSLLINIALIMGYAERGFVDLFSTFGKIIIFWGMTQPRFSYLEEDLKQFLLGGAPSVYFDSVKGGLNLVNINNGSKEREIQWIKERVLSNSKKGLRTIMLIIYDLITPADIRNGEIEEELYFVRILAGNRGPLKTFEEKIITIDDDMNQVDILFNDIISYSNERNVPCEIILYSLSHMIHTHGWRRIYSFMTSKIPVLKSSQVQFLSFYYPETHENISDILKFEKIADNVIKQ